MSDVKTVVEGEVKSALSLQKELETVQAELSSNEKFQQFLQLSKAVADKNAEIRDTIKRVIIPAYQNGEVEKKQDFNGFSVTVTEEDKFKIDEDQLPKTYFKKVVNTALIKSDFQLKGKAPKGAEHFKSYGIMLKMKEAKSE